MLDALFRLLRALIDYLTARETRSDSRTAEKLQARQAELKQRIYELENAPSIDNLNRVRLLRIELHEVRARLANLPAGNPATDQGAENPD